MTTDRAWAERFPALFAPRHVGYANADVTFTTAPGEVDDLNRLHLVAVTTEGLVVVCRSVQDGRFLPGGTREPGEAVPALAERELREESGCRLLAPPRLVARHVARSRNGTPFREHLSHPVSSWGYAVAPVAIDSTPTNPDGGEQVVEVCALPPAEAAAYLREHDDIHAEVVLLVEAMGLIER